MNEDYLWNKTGVVDPEIERLENALQAFRYRETALPVVAVATAETSAVENSPAPVIPFRKRRTRRMFALAAAACIAFVLIGAGVLRRQTSTDKIAVVSETAKAQTSEPAQVAGTVAPPTRTKNAASDLPPNVDERNRSTEKRANTVKIRETVNRKSPVKQRFISTFKTVSAPSNKAETIARNDVAGNKTANRNVRLTADEQRAYSQLMLALSITNSKLNLVRDKITNIREQTTVKDVR